MEIKGCINDQLGRSVHAMNANITSHTALIKKRTGAHEALSHRILRSGLQRSLTSRSREVQVVIFDPPSHSTAVGKIQVCSRHA